MLSLFPGFIELSFKEDWRRKVKGRRLKGEMEKMKSGGTFDNLEVWKRSACLRADIYKAFADVKAFGLWSKKEKTGAKTTKRQLDIVSSYL